LGFTEGGDDSGANGRAVVSVASHVLTVGN
jgi:hypothetical protein